MAAQSRLALRSAHRSSLGLVDVPATVNQRNPSPVNLRKRTRDPSTDDDNPKPPKRTHDDPRSRAPNHSFKVYSRKLATRDIAAPALEEPVTHPAAKPPTPVRPTIVVQQHLQESSLLPLPQSRVLNGSPVETHQSSLTVRNADRRSLRSHDGGSRFKSELALYFGDYDEVLTDVPRDQGSLTPSTRIYIFDEPLKSSIAASSPLPAITDDTNGNPATPYHQSPPFAGIPPDSTPHDNRFKLNGVERLDFSSEERHARQITDDPLTDEYYFKAHRRAERGEKSHRNRERESAQHEKVQLERILDELQGQSWLKTMGITGVTDSEKKIYEPKRMIFIQRVTALLEKFKAWKEEEKRRKAERERAYATDDGEDEDEEGMDTDVADSPGGYDGVNERNSKGRRVNENSRTRNHMPKEGTTARVGYKISSRNAHRHKAPILPLPPEKPFTSFYSKPYMRDAALSKHRRGRTRFAFGQQLPDLEEQDFKLPSEMLTRRDIAASARSRRAAKRDIKEP